MSRVPPRNVTPIIAWVRDTLSGRKLKSMHRYEGEIAPRTQVDPHLPVGPSHVVSNNWYYARDGRRIGEAPSDVYHQKALPSGEQSATPAPAKVTVPKPGFGYDWSTGGRVYTSWAINQKSLYICWWRMTIQFKVADCFTYTKKTLNSECCIGC